MTETTQIEAGRELDALVAVEVMGWMLEGSARGTLRLMAPGRGVAAIKERGREWSYTGYPKPILPDWSTSGACLEVLERMRALGWIGVCKVSTDTRSYARFSRNARTGETHAINGEDVEADTLPHAVCLAALEAVRA